MPTPDASQFIQMKKYSAISQDNRQGIHSGYIPGSFSIGRTLNNFLPFTKILVNGITPTVSFINTDGIITVTYTSGSFTVTNYGVQVDGIQHDGNTFDLNTLPAGSHIVGGYVIYDNITIVTSFITYIIPTVTLSIVSNTATITVTSGSSTVTDFGVLIDNTTFTSYTGSPIDLTTITPLLSDGDHTVNGIAYYRGGSSKSSSTTYNLKIPTITSFSINGNDVTVEYDPGSFNVTAHGVLDVNAPNDYKVIQGPDSTSTGNLLSMFSLGSFHLRPFITYIRGNITASQTLSYSITQPTLNYNGFTNTTLNVTYSIGSYTKSDVGFFFTNNRNLTYSFDDNGDYDFSILNLTGSTPLAFTVYLNYSDNTPQSLIFQTIRNVYVIPPTLNSFSIDDSGGATLGYSLNCYYLSDAGVTVGGIGDISFLDTNGDLISPFNLGQRLVGTYVITPFLTYNDGGPAGPFTINGSTITHTF